jgi:hypothetical protein
VEKHALGVKRSVPSVSIEATEHQSEALTNGLVWRGDGFLGKTGNWDSP